MFMCVVNRKSVNKLDLTWKQSFLIVGRKQSLDHDLLLNKIRRIYDLSHRSSHLALFGDLISLFLLPGEVQVPAHLVDDFSDGLRFLNVADRLGQEVEKVRGERLA
jgi:hypothetical protein